VFAISVGAGVTEGTVVFVAVGGDTVVCVAVVVFVVMFVITGVIIGVVEVTVDVKVVTTGVVSGARVVLAPGAGVPDPPSSL
jgi:hypothetical protein